MAFRLLQISDLHFGTEVEAVLHSLKQKIKKLDPTLVVVTGDITQRATKTQFLKAKAFFNELAPAPFICCPGNHDISLFNIFSRLFAPYGRYQKILNSKPDGFYANAELELLVLNSTSRFRHIDGKLDINYLAKQLEQFSSPDNLPANSPDKQTDKWKVVALHHPLDCKQKIDEKNLLLNAPQVMQMLAQQGVDVVMGGHIHDPIITTSEARYPTLRKKVLISVCGTGISHRTRRNAPNSFMVYDFEKNPSPAVTNQRFDFDSAVSEFKLITQRVF